MNRRVELGVGISMIAGILALAYLSMNLGRVDFLGRHGYVVFGVFTWVGVI
jgi:hypothetical protein